MERLIRFADRYQWVLLVAAAPFMLFPSSWGSLALLVIPLILLISWLARREPIPVTPLNGAILLLAVMVLVSLWVTYDMRVSLTPITTIMLGFASYFCLARYSRDAKGLKWAFIAILFTAPVLAGLGLIGTRWASGKIDAITGITQHFPVRIASLSQDSQGFNPNIVAGTLLWILPLMICTAVLMTARALASPSGRLQSGTRLSRWLLAIVVDSATAFTLGVFLLTQSRASYLALALVLLGMLVVVVQPRWRVLLLGVYLLGVIGGVVIVRQYTGATLLDLLLGSASGIEDGGSIYSMQDRLELWSRALYVIQDFPLTGLGMNIFPRAVHQLYPLFVFDLKTYPSHAHNEFLEMAVDLGLPALIAFIALYIGAFTILMRLMRGDSRSQDNQRSMETGGVSLKVLALGLSGGLAAHILYGMVHAVIPLGRSWFVFWMLLGLVAGLNSYFPAARGR